jgi:hypothetical protein
VFLFRHYVIIALGVIKAILLETGGKPDPEISGILSHIVGNRTPLVSSTEISVYVPGHRWPGIFRLVGQNPPRPDR